MKGLSNLAGRTAVVTGGASGIGRGLAERFIAEGMNVVIADIEDTALHATATAIGATPVQVDVSDALSVQALAQSVQDRFGRIDIVCNNAGIGPFARISDLSLKDWQWMISVNLWGVIHGVHAFLPHLLSNPDGGWMVNTASMGGVSTFPGLGAYATTKFGVVALSETLAMEMEQDDSGVGVTLLLPGPVHSNLGKSARNRPPGLSGGRLADTDLSALPQYRDTLPWKEPAEVAGMVVQAIMEGRLYAVTHPEQVCRVEQRSAALLAAFGKTIAVSDS